MSVFEIITTVLSVSAVIISLYSVRYTRKQYLSDLKPDLWINNTIMKWNDREVTFDLTNRGSVAHIERIIPKSKNIVHISNSCPLEIEKEESKYIYFKYKGKGDPAKESFKVKIEYLDKDENLYKGIIKKINTKHVFRRYKWWKDW